MSFIQKRHVVSLGVILVSFVFSVSSQCDRMKGCPNGGLCANDCKTDNSAASGVEIVVVIMSISVVLIVGLVVLLVYICFKKGPFTDNRELSDSNESRTPSCQTTAVEIFPDRRRFSSMSMTTGPPPYFSLFEVFLNRENGEIRSTSIQQNTSQCEITPPRLLSVDQLPDYHVLFGQSPPRYDEVVHNKSAEEQTDCNSAR